MINKTKTFPLDTYLLCTPYEHKYHRDFDGDLLEEDFHERLYVEPHLEKDLNAVNEEIANADSKINTYSTLDLINEQNEEKEELISQKRSLERIIKEKQNFEKSISHINAGEILYIRGSSGCGKSTYLNRLLYNAKKGGANCYNFNLENSTAFPYLLNHKWENSLYSDNAFRKTDYKLISVILYQINLLLDMNELSRIFKWDSKECEKKYLEYITQLKDNLSLFFLKPAYDHFSYYSSLFRIMNDYCNNRIHYSAIFDEEQVVASDSYSKKISDVIFSLCDESLEQIQINSISSPNNTINKLLDLFFVLSFCTLKKESIINKDYKFIISFDNIEHYIDNHAIYDRDILNITKIITEYVNSAIINLFRGTSISFDGNYQFILCIRDTTEEYIYKTQHQHDFRENSINLTKWYYLSEIHQSRYDFLNEENYFTPSDKDVYDVIQCVLNDITVFRNSTGKAIERMYNYNKRRITMYLCDVFACNKESIYEYKSLWERANNSNGSASCYKNAARSYIIRLLLNRIHATDYFYNLHVVEQGGDLGSGYARRLITFLYNRHLKSDDENYVGFYDLVKSVLQSPCMSHPVSQRMCNFLAEIIVKMCDPEIYTTKWCQLVVLHFNQQSVDVRQLSLKLMEAYRYKNNNPEIYGIKITDAGSFFAEILPHFEYFATRYCNNSQPLFSEYNISKKTIESLIDIDDKKERLFQCYDLIETVKSKSFECIDNIVNFEIDFFSGRNGFNPHLMENGDYLWRKNSSYKNKGVCHPKRIIDHHIGYLDNFRIYILEYNERQDDSSNGFILQREDKIILVKYVLSTIKEYITKLRNMGTPNNGIVYLNIGEDILNKYDEAYSKELKKIENNDLSYNRILSSFS